MLARTWTEEVIEVVCCKFSMLIECTLKMKIQVYSGTGSLLFVIPRVKDKRKICYLQHTVCSCQQIIVINGTQ